MKTKILLFSLTVFVSYGIAWAQPTSYGNLDQGNAGGGGSTINSYFGYQAGLNNNTGNHNTFVGYQSGYDNISGHHNTFVGAHSGNSTTGSNNTFIGHGSGSSNTTGSGNIFIGMLSGYWESVSNRLFIENSGSSFPLIWGDFANNILNFNGTVGIGLDPDNSNPPTQALDVQGTARLRGMAQSIGFDRVLVADADGTIGWREDSSIGNNHDFPSYPASAGDAGGITNAYFGHLAGATATGINNTFIGSENGSNSTGNDNTLVGYRSGLNNTTGFDNSGLGSRTLENNTIGYRNTANGVYTLHWNSEGDENTAVGYAALGFNSTGSDNTAVGYLAMRGNFTQSLNTGNSNAAMGYQAMLSNDAGTGNTAIGRDALSANTAGNNNVALGRDALTVNVSGDENIAIGFNSGATAGNTGLNTTIAIGSSASVGADDAIAIGNIASAVHTNSIAIGNNATTTLDNQLMIGNAYITDITAVAEIQTMSDGRFKKGIEEDVPGLAFIEKLRPVSYELDRNKLHTFLTGKAPQEMNTASSDARQNGFIAQEVAQITEENDYAFSGVKKPANENDTYAIRYAQFVVPLTKAVQELSAIVEAQQQEIDELKNLLYGDTKATDSSVKTSGTTDTAGKDGFALYQNIPNPFDKTATISARVPETVRQAKIAIYNLNGLELQSYDLNKRGNVAIEISGGILPSGMYLYALIADGQIIDTKKMILTK